MLDVAIYNSSQHCQIRHGTGPLVLARNVAVGSIWRPIEVAPAGELAEFLELRATDGGIRMQRSGQMTNVACADQTEEAAAGIEIPLPAAFRVGDTRLEVVDVAAKRLLAPRELQELSPEERQLAAGVSTQTRPAAATVARWLEALSTLHRWIATSQQFYLQAACFAVDAIGLDGAMILRRRDDRWKIVASHLPQPELGIMCEFDVLDRLLVTRNVLFEGAARNEIASEVRILGESVNFALSRLQQGRQDVESGRSSVPRPQEGQALVVAPLIDCEGSVTGAVYAFRTVHRGNSRRLVRHLEARLVRVLAESVSAGIVRFDREARAARQSALFEQAFSPSVATVLEQDPTALHGQEREVSMLFADLRNFTSLCAELPTAESYQLLEDVMDCLTAAVLDHEGVVVDYYGDGLSAMWNAPLAQPDHPELACRAGLAMQHRLPQVSERWRHRLKRELRLGVGVNTGLVQVGNVGSSRRLKYGPRGATVNLTSRVEAATKRLRLPLLATRATAERLSSRMMTFRACQANLTGHAESVDLFAVLLPTDEPRVLEEINRYQRALQLYEAGKLAQADELLAAAHQKNDAVPARFLTEEIQSRLGQQQGRRQHDRTDFDPGGAIALEVK